MENDKPAMLAVREHPTAKVRPASFRLFCVSLSLYLCVSAPLRTLRLPLSPSARLRPVSGSTEWLPRLAALPALSGTIFALMVQGSAPAHAVTCGT